MNSVTLIGMPGAGKSTIGRRLAGQLGFRFIDLDVLIKEKEDKSHTQIVKEKGDAELLRLEETYTLALDFMKTVFSPGGSIIYSPLAMEKLRSETTIIYLELPFLEIKKRLGLNLEHRGIVGLGKNGLEGLYKERAPLYRRFAHRTIDCRDLSDKEVIKRIYEILQH